MKRKLASAIVRYRVWILAAMLILSALSAACIGKTRINYDLNRYLSEDTMTRRALVKMQEEFGSAEQLRMMFTGRSEAELDGIVDALNGMDEVLLAVHDPEADVNENGVIRQLVTVSLNDCDASALVTRLRAMFPEAGQYCVGGSAAALLDAQESVAREIPRVMVIAVAVVLLVLLVTSRAWLEPLVLLIVLALSIVINMGTNFIFPDVSFITFAVCAILQLALSIDYAIMLLHAFNDRKDEGMSGEEAMTEALAECFMRIFSSAMTTAAGLLSLLFMSFTIGFDIGLVLSKGILISMLGVFLMMPAVTLIFEKPLRATRHAPLRLGGAALARFLRRTRVPVAVLLVAAAVCGAFLTSQNTYTFSDTHASPGSENAAIRRVFGASDPLVILVPGGEEDEDYNRQRALAEALKGLKKSDGQPAVGEIASMVTTGAQALEYYTAGEVAEIAGLSGTVVRLFFLTQGFGESVRADRLLAAAGSLGGEQVEELTALLDAARSAVIGPTTQRMLLTLNFINTDPDFEDCMDDILAACRGVYGEDFYVTGVPMSSYDIGHAFKSDLLRVNIITFLAILLIVTASFRSLRLPLTLVFVIEGAIWITMGISRLLGESLFFMCYLICLSIQMGATIDYGILLSDQYRSLRRAGQDSDSALSQALHRSLPTVLTSGVILVTAGFIIGQVCTVYYISSIGALLARGAAISALLVLVLLPSLLSLFDRFLIERRD